VEGWTYSLPPGAGRKRGRRWTPGSWPQIHNHTLFIEVSTYWHPVNDFSYFILSIWPTWKLLYLLKLCS
jgi:hypothetical protein